MSLSSSLNYIIEQSKTELMGYTFQVYALFVASSDQITELYKALTMSLIENRDNWNQDMKYLIPSLG